MNAKAKTLLLSVLIAVGSGTGLSANARQNDSERYLDSLYRMMNPADKVNRSAEFYTENAVLPSLKAAKEMPWGKTVPEKLFVHFVLPLRVNNEAMDSHRPLFYEELKPRLKGLSMEDAILEVNHWCHEKASYQPSDGRTHSPLQTVSSGIGRCGEESTFTVAALRSVGIPARQVYTPRWAHTDDNHAWVEAWANGKWYFLGACEPEPVLNRGWFNYPASRGILMHARVPGFYTGPEEVLAHHNGNTDINVTANYAPVDTLNVIIKDAGGNPVKGAKVSFRVYNYAEFYPVAEKISDNDGKASIVAGLGDILVWATDGHKFGFSKARVGQDRNSEITLNLDSDSKQTIELDLTPPKPTSSQVVVTPRQRSDNDRRLAAEDSIRNRYIASFPTDKEINALAAELNINSRAQIRMMISERYFPTIMRLMGQAPDSVRRNAMKILESFTDEDLMEIGKEVLADENKRNATRLRRIITDSRGNYPAIIQFLKQTPDSIRPKVLNLLESLTEKDLTDVSVEVLSDHLKAPDIHSAMFDRYIMSPRIANEELTPFRSRFLNAVSKERARAFQSDPDSWIAFARDSIDASLQWYPDQATMDPWSVWNHRSTSKSSRDIFFVAGARSFGIPSRIDPVTGMTQIYRDGKWENVSFETEKANGNEARTGSLMLDFAATAVVDDPKYFANFTLSRITDGEPHLLNYPDFEPYSSMFNKPLDLECGQYLLVTGQRKADGGVLASMKIITIGEGLNRDSLTVRHDPTAIEVLGSFNSENIYLPEGAATVKSILSTTGRGYYVLGIVKHGHEPSNHALRDISAARAALERCGRPIVMLYECGNASAGDIDVTLPSTMTCGTDNTGAIRAELTENLKLKETELPIFVIADTFNRVVFVSQGYTIGLGDKIAETLRKLE